MKTLSSLIVALFLTVNLFGQEQFRVDCNLVSILPSLDAEWSEWFEAPNTFVVNANDNNDIIHYRGDGQVVVYRNLGGLESSYTDNGERYQFVQVLDEDGNPMTFQLFDNQALGVKLIKNGMVVQFSKYE